MQVRAQPVHGPAWISTLDRTAPLQPISVSSRYVAARLLVMVGDVPVGMATVRLDRGHASAEAVGRALTAQLGPLRPVRRPPASPAPVTAVVATRGRANSLARCVRSILAGDHPAITVLVVDNAPDDDRTLHAVQALADPRVRYIREPRRGASVGRNRGLFEATTPVVLFTDDDTEVDRAWATRMAGAFAQDPTLGLRERAGARGAPGHRAGTRRRHRAGLEQGLPAPAGSACRTRRRIRRSSRSRRACSASARTWPSAPSSRGPRAGSTRRSARARPRTAAKTASS